MDGLPDDVPLLDPPVVEVGRAKDKPLWGLWYYLTLLVGLLGAEWCLRRHRHVSPAWFLPRPYAAPGGACWT
jgi:hypothetical protein